MSSRIAVVSALIVSLAILGCGGSTKKQNEPGVVLQNGTTLKGSAAKAYCDRFEQAPPDAKTAAACAAVGSINKRTQDDAADATRATNYRDARSAIEPLARELLGKHFKRISQGPPPDGVRVQTDYPEATIRKVPSIYKICDKFAAQTEGLVVLGTAHDGEDLDCG